MVTKLLMMRVLVGCAVLLAAVGTTTDVAIAAPTAEDVENAIEANLGLPAGSFTYLDFTDSSTGDSKDGLTISQTASGDDWGYPDDSNTGEFVNENSLDDKFNTASDFEITITGLAASTNYLVYYDAVGRGVPSTNFDFSWGTDSDGAAINYVDGVSNTSGIVPIASSGCSTNYAVPLGSVASDGTGTLKMWVGNADAYNLSAVNRTQIDGIALGVPEPATILLLGLGGIALILSRKR